ncbi:4'-phosphopantetheinyl transferase [Arthrobacter sp. yr096]|uniref:4'-phosphopantetheinyl transferase family protein n=1 Tax=Arthrobacter sp. yr096 TaxID=1761750 RepID=UPI0008BAA69F|nr:4'-phosphopantetheinyl transferase superfamily protein [Arthrobacter sp. yr096]SEI98827.1 4'-phosphopantetheinyl transferase [Arthrobacter sp. yr096]
MTAQAGTPGVGYLILPSASVGAACSSVGGLDRFLGPDERIAGRRFRTVEDSRDYAASHVLLRLLAAHRLGLDALAAPGLNITRYCPGCGSSGHGRTVLPGMSLSLSRSHGLVMAVAGPAAASVGADVERVPSALFEGFDEYVLSPAAASVIAKTGVRERMRQWVAKEAVLKAAGVGLSVPPSAVSLVSDGNGAEALRADCPEQPLVHGFDVYPVPAISTHVAAVSAIACGPPAPRDANKVLPQARRGSLRAPSKGLNLSGA